MVERIAFTQSPRWRLLVLGVGPGVGIGHAHQDARRPLEEIGERLHEADGAARADHGRLLAEARLEGTARGVEGRTLGVGGPPRRGALDRRGYLHAVGRLGGELLHDEPAGLARVHAGTVRRESRAGAASMIWLDEPRNVPRAR